MSGRIGPRMAARGQWTATRWEIFKSDEIREVRCHSREAASGNSPALTGGAQARDGDKERRRRGTLIPARHINPTDNARHIQPRVFPEGRDILP